MANAKRKSKPLKKTTEKGHPDSKAKVASELTEQELLSEEQVDTMLDDISDGNSKAIDRVESDQVLDDSSEQQAESISEAEESSNVAEPAVDPVVQDSVEEINNETLQEMPDDRPTSEELENKSDYEVNDDSGHLEPSRSEVSEVMNDLDLNIESESYSISQDSAEETDNGFQSEPLQLDRDEDRPESSVLEDEATQVLSAHDRNQCQTTDY